MERRLTTAASGARSFLLVELGFGAMATAYEKKFANFLKMCEEAKQEELDVVVLHHPEVLGDNYAEIVESLNRIADAQLSLSIIPRGERDR